MEAPDPDPETLVDLDRYPLNRSEGAAYRLLVEQVRADLAAHGMFTLPAFLRPEIAAREGPPLACAVGWSIRLPVKQERRRSWELHRMQLTMRRLCLNISAIMVGSLLLRLLSRRR